MRKIFGIGILGIVTMMGNASAQVPSECGGEFSGYASCHFACQAGDFITVGGYGGSNFAVTASCGGAGAICYGPGGCTAQSVRAVAYDWENGFCQAEADMPCEWDPEYWCQAPGVYRCASVTPEEAAKLKASGQAFVIQTPEQ